jgi:imidazolonepropionase-like amidohydrolase
MRALLLLILLLPFIASAKASVFIRGATVIDGLGGTPLENTDIEVIDGRIARIGPNLKTQVKNVIQAQGKFVMPGLIDSHTHLHSVPGSRLRGDSMDQLVRARPRNLRSYLAAGVTTVLDCAAPESLFAEIKTAGDENPRILALAPFLTPEGGYFSSSEARSEIYKDLTPPIKDAADLKRELERAKPWGALGLKTTVEAGFGPFDVWPVFDAKMRAALREEAARLGVPIFVHSMSKREHRLALELKPYVFVHSGFASELPDKAILKEIKDSGAYMISTAAIIAMQLLMFDEKALNDPWTKMLVPEYQLRTALDPKLRKIVVEETVVEGKAKWIPEGLTRLFAPVIFNRHTLKMVYRLQLKSLKRIYEAGIPLIMGSDAGNWPLWTTFFHGVGSILEMEILEEAGIPRGDILVIATSRPAKMMKLENETGSIRPGLSADLLILNENPLLSFKTLRSPLWIVRAGHARAPADWLN